MKEIPRLRLIATREISQRNLLGELTKLIDDDTACDIVVLLAYDDGDHGILTSAMNRSQLVYMLEEAKHDALCGNYDEETDESPGPGPEAA